LRDRFVERLINSQRPPSGNLGCERL
jgi:hypothetical protein